MSGPSKNQEMAFYARQKPQKKKFDSFYAQQYQAEFKRPLGKGSSKLKTLLPPGTSTNGYYLNFSKFKINSQNVKTNL